MQLGICLLQYHLPVLLLTFTACTYPSTIRHHREQIIDDYINWFVFNKKLEDESTTASGLILVEEELVHVIPVEERKSIKEVTAGSFSLYEVLWEDLLLIRK